MRHPLRNSWLPTVALATQTACGILGPDDFVDFGKYTVLPDFQELDYSTVEVSEGIVYWELRRSSDRGRQYEISASGGEVTRQGLTPQVLAILDTISSDEGFAPSCRPGGCYDYVATVAETGDVETWGDPAGVSALLAPIGSVEEAALIAHSHSYYWRDTIESGAYRRVGAGFELVVLEPVRDCNPIQRDIVLVHITEDGDTSVLKRDVHSQEWGVCT